MPIPIAPIAGAAVRYGAVALATYAVTQAIPKLRRDQRAEDVLDDVEEGIALRRDDEQANANLRFRRIVQLGGIGPRFQIDATALTRIRITRV